WGLYPYLCHREACGFQAEAIPQRRSRPLLQMEIASLRVSTPQAPFFMGLLKQRTGITLQALSQCQVLGWGLYPSLCHREACGLQAEAFSCCRSRHLLQVELASLSGRPP